LKDDDMNQYSVNVQESSTISMVLF